MASPTEADSPSHPPQREYYNWDKHPWMKALGWAMFPVIGAVTWFSTILALLLLWIKQGSPKYRTDQADVIYISNVAAHPAFKPIFIAGTVITVVFFVTSLILDRKLRALSGVDRAKRKKDSFLSLMAITFGILASIFLILLSCFDASNYKREHWIFAGVAFSSLITSLAFNLAQNVVLRRQHRTVKALRRTIIVKSTAFAGAVLCIVVMFALQAMCAGQETTDNWKSNPRCNKADSCAAVCEWALAFLVAFYEASLSIDLSPGGSVVVRKQIIKEQMENPDDLEAQSKDADKGNNDMPWMGPFGQNEDAEGNQRRDGPS